MIALHPCLPLDLSADVISLEQNAGSAAASLARRLVQFARALHRAGAAVSPSQTATLFEALQYTGVARRDDLYYMARSTLITRHEDAPLFDRLFAQFFGRSLLQFSIDGQPNAAAAGEDGASHGERTGEVSPEPDREGEEGSQRSGQPRLPLATEAGRDTSEAKDDQSPESDEEADAVDRSGSYSGAEVLRRRDFSDLDRDQQRAVLRLMSRLRLHLVPRVTRRTRPAPRGQRFDLRRSVRGSLRTGGEIITWRRRQRSTRPRPVVLLCDVSGSMSIYSRMLLQFLHAARQQFPQVEVFVFSTRLTSITRQLRSRQPEAALAAVSEVVHDWAGGTRIGDSLGHFNRHWARRVLGRGAIVLLISDGWDRGDVGQLRQEVAHLQRASYRLFWLNPLLGMPGYRPLTRGLLAALPHVDAFLPAHNLESFDHLADVLATVRGRRSPQTLRPVAATG